MTIYYVVLALITAVVAIVVISAGKDEKAQPSIAGGYDATGPAACLGAPPPSPRARRCPPRHRRSRSRTGPSFDVKQSGQFVNFSNTQSTLGGKLRLEGGAAPTAPRIALRRRRLRERARLALRGHGHAG